MLSQQDKTIAIQLSQGYSTTINLDDVSWLMQWAWRGLVTRSGRVYAVCTESTEGSQITLVMHRLIMERIIGKPLDRNQVVDHINGNGLDNRRENLRISTPAENSRNRGKSRSNTSGYKGVSDRYKDGSWIAVITYNRKNIFLGRFPSKIEAAQAYDRAALWYHREFAQLNFPECDYGIPQEPNRPRQKGKTLKSNPWVLSEGNRKWNAKTVLNT